MFDSIISFAFALQVLRITIPYLLAALGATFSERSGVINIALEGILLVGAFCSILVTYYTGNPVVGILGGAAGGALIAIIHAVLTVSIKVNQIVSGIALNILAIGVTKFLCKIVFHSSSNSPRVAGMEGVHIPLFSAVPILGDLLSNGFFLLAAVLTAGSYWLLYRTTYGLRTRAVGENPEASENLGLSVRNLRYGGVLLSGILAGLGGSWLALDQHSFTDNMSAGRGYIALAAMIVGRWNPIGAAAACLLFGLSEGIVIQVGSGPIPTQFIQMLPYLLTIIMLAGFMGRSVPPASVGIPYEK